MPHAPQLSLSTCVLMHVPLQEFWPGAHPQEPALHVCPFWQVVPQIPQFSWSDFTSTHDPEHATSGLAQPVAHAPFEHTDVAPEQTVPHAPQFFGSLPVFTHTPPQRVSPAGHVHLLSPHCSVAPHAVVHAPQCAASLVMSTHDCPHWVSPALQEVSQPPRLQTAPAAQVTPQPPQFCGSVRVLTQALLHVTSPGRVHGPLGPESAAGVVSAPVSVGVVASTPVSTPASSPASVSTTVSSPQPGTDAQETPTRTAIEPSTPRRERIFIRVPYRGVDGIRQAVALDLPAPLELAALPTDLPAS
jgi:hypothetical protein